LREAQLIENYWIIIFVLFALFFAIYRYGGSRRAAPNVEHVNIVRNLDLDEATIGFNEVLSGIAYVDQFGVGSERILKDVEIARSFWLQARDLSGDPPTVSESAKLKRELISLAKWVIKTQPDALSRSMRTAHVRLAQNLDELDEQRRENLERAMRQLGW
jgi:hypothetical protein